MIEVRYANSCAALNDADFDELLAIARLEHQSRTWLIGLTEKVGGLISAMPSWITKALSTALEPSLRFGNQVAAASHLPTPRNSIAARAASLVTGERFHKGAVTASGMVGGLFGAPGALADVAVSTTLVLRSIQEIATSYGEDLETASALADCLTVLSMGGPAADDDTLDEAFWTTRAALHAAINPLAIERLLVDQTMQELASRESIQRVLNSAAMQKVLERFAISTQAAFAEKAVPIIGGVVGAFANYQFMAFYQRMAHVLYRLKRVEAKFESGQVRSCYEQVARRIKAGPL